jgi:hypothetical protein
MAQDTCYAIQEEIIAGALTFAEIAALFDVTVADVNLIAEELNDMIEGRRDIDCAVSDNDYFDDY